MADWRTDADGNPLFDGGAILTARNWARVGELNPAERQLAAGINPAPRAAGGNFHRHRRQPGLRPQLVAQPACN